MSSACNDFLPEIKGALGADRGKTLIAGRHGGTP